MYPPLNVPVPTESWPDDPILGFGLVQLNTWQSNHSWILGIHCILPVPDTEQTKQVGLIWFQPDINHHIDETLVGLLLQLRHRRTADINFKRRRSSIQVFLFLIRICECFFLQKDVPLFKINLTQTYCNQYMLGRCANNQNGNWF